MNTPASKESIEVLESLRVDFERWRKQRPRKRSIPNGLLDRAASLVDSLGIGVVSGTLRLNQKRLKDHVCDINSVPIQNEKINFTQITPPIRRSGLSCRLEMDGGELGPIHLQMDGPWSDELVRFLKLLRTAS